MAVDFDKAAYYYDAMYGNEEEYRTEAEHIRKLAQKYGAGKRLIDIACGTGLAAKYLLRDFCVTGVDLSERMLDKARENAPGARFLRGDMFSFSLREKFDIAVNLYGSAGFAKDTDALAAMCACAYKCLADGGLFILTPWSTRETFAEGITADSGIRGGLAFCRMEAVRRKDARRAEIEMVHLTGENGTLDTVRFVQEISIFSEREYRDALAEAGFCILERLAEAEFRMGAFVCQRR